MYEHLCDISADDHAPNPRLDCGHGYAEVHDEPPPDAIAALAFMTADEQDALVTRAERARTRR